jgi:hypothetical protein
VPRTSFNEEAAGPFPILPPMLTSGHSDDLNACFDFQMCNAVSGTRSFLRCLPNGLMTADAFPTDTMIARP